MHQYKISTFSYACDYFHGRGCIFTITFPYRNHDHDCVLFTPLICVESNIKPPNCLWNLNNLPDRPPPLPTILLYLLPCEFIGRIKFNCKQTIESTTSGFFTQQQTLENMTSKFLLIRSFCYSKYKTTVFTSSFLFYLLLVSKSFGRNIRRNKENCSWHEICLMQKVRVAYSQQ